MQHQNDSNTDLLATLWRSWAERGAQLRPDEWAGPTRLPGWSVHALFAHVAPDPAMFGQLRGALTEGPAAITGGAEILRVYNQPGGVAHVSAEAVEERARQVAESVPPEVLLVRFAEEGPNALSALADIPADAVIAHPMLGSVTFGALGEVAVMEATVHLLDLIAAVGGPPPPTAALEATRGLLVAVADPIAFIEAATGRTDAAVLPVLR
ncbi:maleylpyruvate isomerase N-terminal domain-containing protein [Kitasatospora sp. GP82]|uniref:maleylpyruvate isomerase N-terminal domain-containing protein n=1 Tax=Kitasatospora sp. GP82 TaxID=3035089 RepID=UPI00247477B3|nr:maleylpyruvate isomerase N-terminal domain-containing protein [Kitasatospora sp. GP82]